LDVSHCRDGGNGGDRGFGGNGRADVASERAFGVMIMVGAIGIGEALEEGSH
jgi:hypothetical protein